MKPVKGQPMYIKTKANPYSHQVQVILVKKDLLFGVILLSLKRGGGEPRASCNYRGTTYACDTKLNGTTTMRTHIQSQCLKYPYRKDKEKKKKTNQPYHSNLKKKEKVVVNLCLECLILRNVRKHWQR